ncbi:MAG: SAM-dependent chlorinase/fluorinase [Acidobacteria bacterium]|nr:SAM-dependent chlorinase/fluorinase [Acidobacteriota bacterium]MCW5971597.1 SAM-dependent chlorinase/fluorinase [Blastocatellales bacterium]
MSRVITLLTDFGSADYFAPALKGAILSINPAAIVIDLTHDIPPHDIPFGAFTLGACFRDFPQGAVHLAVVDPGVGSARRAIVVEADGRFFVGPDNGLFSYVYEKSASVRVYHAVRADLFRPHPSATFHGRDVFAPLAAHLSLGLAPDSAGPKIYDFSRFPIPRPHAQKDGEIQGEILHIDRFGNCITNFTEHELAPSSIDEGARIEIGDCVVENFGTHFAEGADGGGMMAYPGSAGYWEIGAWCASAAARCGVRRGARVVLWKKSM